jgi:hypothetical protein
MWSSAPPTKVAAMTRLAMDAIRALDRFDRIKERIQGEFRLVGRRTRRTVTASSAISHAEIPPHLPGEASEATFAGTNLAEVQR